VQLAKYNSPGNAEDKSQLREEDAETTSGNANTQEAQVSSMPRLATLPRNPICNIHHYVQHSLLTVVSFQINRPATSRLCRTQWCSHCNTAELNTNEVLGAAWCVAQY
jgi:hypothetical protein